MKYVLSVCIFTAFFLSSAHCDCMSTCLSTYHSDIQGLTLSASQICPFLQKCKNCLDQTCKIDVSQYQSYLNEVYKNYGFTCDLNSASRSVSLSLLTVCGSALLTAYRIFSM